MKLIFVSSGEYPNGGAATNRHLAYAKGLRELGHDIEFILLSTQQWQQQELIEEDIKFTCVCADITNENLKLKKIKSFLKTIENAKQRITAIKKESNNSKLILLDTKVTILLPLLKQAKKLGLKTFHERTEYPFVVSEKTILGKIDLNIYLKFVIKKFDGIYVINKALKNYFLKKTNNKVPVVIINMLVDPERFSCNETSLKSEKLITYCGTLDGDKDGVPILIEAFSLIASEFPAIKLQLIGSLNNDVTRKQIYSQIQKLNLDNKIIITGSVQRNVVPQLLCNSYILALARPANKQAEGGFPTKLGEYLATGNIVVVTNVGEIGLFLKDGENAYISEPNSAEKFSSKLKEALLNSNPQEIGNEGKKLVYNEFNYLTQAALLEELFNSVV